MNSEQRRSEMDGRRALDEDLYQGSRLVRVVWPGKPEPEEKKSLPEDVLSRMDEREVSITIRVIYGEVEHETQEEDRGLGDQDQEA